MCPAVDTALHAPGPCRHHPHRQPGPGPAHGPPEPPEPDRPCRGDRSPGAHRRRSRSHPAALEPLYAANYRGQSTFHEDPQGAWLRFYSISPYNAYNRFVVDSLLAGWLAQLSSVAGMPLHAERIDIEFEAPAYAEQYQGLCLTPVHFAAETNQLRLNRNQLELRNSTHCPSTWQHLLQLCELELEQRTRIRSLSERIVQLLGPLLSGGHEPDLEEIANRLQLPTWTLRRKLAEEGTQFRTILNDTRRDLAMAYIRDTELAFGEIAYLLGFASAEAFQRAFKRWSGVTPGDFRRSQRRTALSSVASSAGSGRSSS